MYSEAIAEELLDVVNKVNLNEKKGQKYAKKGFVQLKQN